MVASLSRIFSLCWGAWGDRTTWCPPCSRSSGGLLHFASQRFMIIIAQDGLYMMRQMWRHPHGVAGEYQGWKNRTGLDTWIGNWRVRPQYQILPAQAPATGEENTENSVTYRKMLKMPFKISNNFQPVRNVCHLADWTKEAIQIFRNKRKRTERCVPLSANKAGIKKEFISRSK